MKVTEEILSTARIPGTSTALRTTRAAELTATQERTGTSEKADIRRTSYGSGSTPLVTAINIKTLVRIKGTQD